MYDYIITKPELNEDTLAHYGIKGMKWKKRKDKKRKDKYVADHLAEDVAKGRRRETDAPYIKVGNRPARLTKEFTRSVMKYSPDRKKVVAVLAQTYKNSNDTFGSQAVTTEKAYNKALKSAKKRKRNSMS